MRPKLILAVLALALLTLQGCGANAGRCTVFSPGFPLCGI
jgi:hypothetical protein